MDIHEMSTAVSEVIGHLRANGFDSDAVELEGLLAKVQSGASDANQAIQDIQARCHIKWLGDVPIRELSFNDWVRLLEKVRIASS